MSITFTECAWEEHLYWHQQDQSILSRIHLLLREIQRHPFTGIGKPEPLRGPLAGTWSRRIDARHRLVYQVEKGRLIALQCRFHYGK